VKLADLASSSCSKGSCFPAINSAGPGVAQEPGHVRHPRGARITVPVWERNGSGKVRTLRCGDRMPVYVADLFCCGAPVAGSFAAPSGVGQMLIRYRAR
jgi:hypothetical protein